MQSLAAFLYYTILYPLSLLPFWMLYAISDVLRIFFYYIFKFRLKVIRANIARSFPDKSKAELRKIERIFYRHMCDLIVESVKAFSISEKLAIRKFSYANPEIFKQLHDQNKSVVLVGGHYGNWELLAVTINQAIPHRTMALYTPLTNAFFDKKMKASRGKFGLEMFPIDKVKQYFEETKSIPITAIFGADQSPRNAKKAYWMNFLNQETGVQFGAEKFAKEYNCAVVYGVINRLARGKYVIDFKLLCEDAKEMSYGKITELHTKLLEQKIIESPPFWLWSHKRWKHKRPAECKLHT